MSTLVPDLKPDDVIQFSHVSKWYKDVIGINQVTLGIGPGVTGLLGPNGAGKSTMMKLMTGQLRPDTGTMQVAGKNPWNDSTVFREMGYCPDTDSFYEEMNAQQFVILMGRMAGYSAAESRRRAEESLARVSMAAHMKRKIRGYSKGMRQRTKLAAALIHDPNILILDEPLNGLDPMGRHEMLTLFKELGRSGKTVLVSSHILHEIENLTQQIALIHHGRILAEGQIEDIRALIENQPLTLRVETPDRHRVGAELAAMETVSSLSYAEDDNSVVVRSNRPESVYETLQTGVVERKYSVDGLTALDDNLDAVFSYLVKE
ncbi:MAG: ABC transporter ATP-binding protein [Candidatus Sumerlaeaceae bacterium]|nr:ABC transporter ATP-binding protein [Candidatus Sumerlaeaceae bacterium]